MWKQSRTHLIVSTCLIFGLLFLDQSTKFLALTYLSNGNVIPLIPHFLSLRLLFNPGATLGFGSSETPLVALIEFLACVIFLILDTRTKTILWTIAFNFAFAGSLGNLIDRIIYARSFLNGSVVDFLDYGWSIGNIADIELTVAAVLIIYCIVFSIPLKNKDH